MFRGGLLSTGFTLGFSSGSPMGPVTMDSNRKVLCADQGITEHVSWRSVQNGFPFGFLRQVLMFLSNLIYLVSPSMFRGGLLSMGFTSGFFSSSTMGPVTLGGNRTVLCNHQGITEHLGGGLFSTGFTLGFTRQCFVIIQGITEHVLQRSVKHRFHFGFLFGFHHGSCYHGWQQESASRSPGSHRACSAEVCSAWVSL